MLRASARHEHHIALLSLHGDLTEETGQMLPGLQELIDNAEKKIILNMQDVSYVNSAGLSSFIESYKTALRSDVKLAMCNMQPQVFKVFKLARVEVFIPIYPTEGKAFKHFGVMVADNSGPPKEQILVIEPGLAIGDEMQRLLLAQKEQLNYRISRVPTFTEALRFIELRETNVVFIDVTFPRKETERFIGMIRTTPKFRVIPLIIATPDDQIPDADFLIRNGADDMIRLPLTQYEISSRLRTALTLHYAMANDESQLEKLRDVKLQAAKYTGSNYPTLK